MHCTRKITNDLYWVGANDRRTPKFENIHPIPEGMAYNSYLLMDEKTVLFDTADWSVSRQFLENVKYVLNERTLDYIIVQHVEPDHSTSLSYIMNEYPEATIICTAKAKQMLHQFGFDTENSKIELVKEGNTLSTGTHHLTFMMAPMVHWPEVMVTYDEADKALFAADAFGSFGALNGRIFSNEVDYKAKFEEYSRRYYSNIVGKYGPQVSNLLKKVAKLDIEYICSLHGLVYKGKEDIEMIIDKYSKWSKYEPEEQGVLIPYASMYGNTENAAEILASKLSEKGFNNYELYDVSSIDNSYLLSSAFKFSHIAIFCVTYNLSAFPEMLSFIDDMKLHNLQHRTISVFENGTWAPQAGNVIKKEIEEMKNMTLLDDVNTIKSSVSMDLYESIEILADSILDSMKK